MMGLVQRRPFRGPWDKYPLPIIGEGETNGANLKQLSRHSGECALGSAIPGKEHLKNIDHVSQMFLLKHFENIRKTF